MFRAVSVTHRGATSELPNAIGILPMLYTSRAPAPKVGFDLVMKGTQGDLMILVVAGASTPPVVLPGFLHGLEVNTAVLLPLIVGAILAPSGELRLPIPAFDYTGPAYVQALFVGNNPGYAPGSFSNVLTFR